MQTTDIPSFDTFGFDPDKYFELQKQAIHDRMDKFESRLYLEVGGKFFYDPHAARVLPGFDPQVKLMLFQDLAADMQIIFCINAHDIIADRQMHSLQMSYEDSVMHMLEELEDALSVRPLLSINRIIRNHEAQQVT